MNPLIECVPNFSEGRNQATIDELLSVFRSSPGVTLLDYSFDVDHNRSVFTMVGEPKLVQDAIISSAHVAKKRIDLRTHTGAHPRVGALDVIPFIPLFGLSMQQAAEVSRSTAQRLWEEVGIPSYLYEASALRDEHKNLAEVRRGEFEGLPKKILDPLWTPDVGGTYFHPSAGISCIGARNFLCAFNVNLATTELAIAQAIAHEVRERDGGLPYCKALGLALPSKQCVQVSMNLTNYHVTSILTAFQAVSSAAKRYGVEILESEIIGMIPLDAMVGITIDLLKLKTFTMQQVLIPPQGE